MSPKIKNTFENIATRVTLIAGSVWACALSVTLILGWAVAGPFYGYSDTWQLVANTFTTLIVFVMVFLIQNTQNREGKAIQLKLDEIIFKFDKADNSIIGIENLSEDQIADLASKYDLIAKGSRLGNADVPID